ncbi:uncharacterized protein LACBIDRAFT_322627 [Laccaria bicolor S238N-H82]|uniref:Predicted protein n=1 Tax=Laccaria bicolor (strain S238N-H82 / ATCC MYA-4686) TaxID=486041 RepID=B0CWZ3_LACBS|nr:uncharacterized protein LACBIDRAFT_322627 [Laccaria bicolor S238N-H82]EDR13154.1 predicted protein [Laccaria bicolor S238N-H82]|eukprot:XP_001875652.1 predicted protein [Laccaria bicolor S238N-H82]
MELVNSVRQYTAMIEHCPNIIRAIVSIQADAFDCDCRRVCYFCFTERPEYFPLTSREAYKLFTLNGKPQSNDKTSRKLFKLAKPPSVLSLPGRYCHAWTTRGGILQSRRLRLYDRPAVAQSLTGSGLPQSDKTTREPKRFMAIISAPVLLNGGRQVDRGFFCLGCRDETNAKTKHFRIKYTTEDLSGHISNYGRVVERMPKGYSRFMHATKD